MKKFLALLALSLMMIFPATSFSDGTGPEANPEAKKEKKDGADKIDRLAGEIIKLFPRAEGKVADAGEKTVTLDFGSAGGLKPGMEVFLFRPGKAIKHPVTKAILGFREMPVGKAVLTEVGEDESKGEIKELEVTRAVKGDTARLSTEKARLLLAVYGKDYNELVVDRLLALLRDSGRFDVSGPVELPREPALGGAAAKAMAAEKGVQDILAVDTAATKKADRTKVSLALFSAEGASLHSLEGIVDAGSEVFVEKSGDYVLVRGERRDFFHTENLPFRAKLMAGGNLTGEGKTECAVSDGRRIIVYRLDQGILREIWREADSQERGHLSLECADLNADGRDEIYVTNFFDGMMASYVIEYNGKDFSVAAGKVQACFRVLDVPGAGKKLITGTIGKDAPYSGSIREYLWKEGKLVEGGKFPLPPKIKDPYGFVLVDLVPDKKPEKKDPKQPLSGLEIVWIDNSDYIQVLSSKGKTLWKSKERYGGYDNFFELDPKSFTVENVDPRGKVKGKLFLKEGPEGEVQIVLTKNLPMTNMLRHWKGYSGAEIYAFSWTGEGLEENWVIRNIEGYLADIFVGDATNQGREEIAIITTPTYKLVKKSKSVPMGAASSLLNALEDKSSLLVYKVPQR